MTVNDLMNELRIAWTLGYGDKQVFVCPEDCTTYDIVECVEVSHSNSSCPDEHVIIYRRR